MKNKKQKREAIRREMEIMRSINQVGKKGTRVQYKRFKACLIPALTYEMQA